MSSYTTGGAVGWSGFIFVDALDHCMNCIEHNNFANNKKQSCTEKNILILRVASIILLNQDACVLMYFQSFT